MVAMKNSVFLVIVVAALSPKTWAKEATTTFKAPAGAKLVCAYKEGKFAVGCELFGAPRARPLSTKQDGALETNFGVRGQSDCPVKLVLESESGATFNAKHHEDGSFEIQGESSTVVKVRAANPARLREKTVPLGCSIEFHGEIHRTLSSASQRMLSGLTTAEVAGLSALLGLKVLVEESKTAAGSNLSTVRSVAEAIRVARTHFEHSPAFDRLERMMESLDTGKVYNENIKSNLENGYQELGQQFEEAKRRALALQAFYKVYGIEQDENLTKILTQLEKKDEKEDEDDKT